MENVASLLIHYMNNYVLNLHQQICHNYSKEELNIIMDNCNNRDTLVNVKGKRLSILLLRKPEQKPKPKDHMLETSKHRKKNSNNPSTGVA